MAITFGLYRKREKKLILFVVIILVVGGVIIGVILAQKQAPRLFLEAEVTKPEPPKINWQTLADPRIEKLQPLIQMPSLTETEKSGRENPFLPY